MPMCCPKMPERTREENIQDYRFTRTTCGLMGFIVFFMASLIFFILAEDYGEYYVYIIILGFVMLYAALVFFCCVLHESKRVDEPLLASLERARLEALPDQPEQEQLLQRQPDQVLPLQPQPDQVLPLQPQPDQVLPLQRQPDQELSDQIHRIISRDSDDSTYSENDSDSDTKALLDMAKYGLPSTSKEPMAGTSKESQDKDIAKCEDVDCDQLHFTEAGPSRFAGRSYKDTESKYEDIPLIDMSVLSLSDHSMCTPAPEEKQTEVSAALSRLSLDHSEEQGAKGTVQGLFTNPEVKSDEYHSLRAETWSKAKDAKSSKLESKKEA